MTTSKAGIDRLLHPDFKEVGESGTSYDYRSIIDMMAAEQPSDGYVHSQDYQCIELAPSVQLLLYQSAWVDELGNKSHFAKRSSIWVLVGNQWQLQYHQGTASDGFS
ncbi:DUF4440 domain-containing protein [Motilimonas sp. E26]|uniref:nuclear transport factor 2 family protein n=2 Tax=Motilimonas TaxID=1914248 RepID=UPI0032B80C7B|nr:DUF4440 domain-containing protein [Motilimonas sp. E26]